MTSIVLVTAAFFISIIVFAVLAIRNQARFNRDFPPLSDEEFLARYTPGVRPEVALRVRRIEADALGIEYERIYPSSRLVEDLGAD